MTEAEWMSCTNPQKMLEFLENKGSDRKLRLFAIACCRRIWKLLANERCHRALEIAEKCAEGSLSLMEAYTLGQALELYIDYDLAKQLTEETGSSTEEACRAALTAAGLIHGWLNSTQAGNVARNASTAVTLQAASHLADYGYDEQAAFEADAAPFREAESAAQAALLRDIFGPLPFRPVPIDPAWLTSTVLALAKAAYDNRNLPSGNFDNARLAVLTDALEDAGCTNQEILNHCCQTDDHVRGCWVIDLLLGKEVQP